MTWKLISPVKSGVDASCRKNRRMKIITIITMMMTGNVTSIKETQAELR